MSLSFRNLRSIGLLKAALVSAPILAGAALLAIHSRSEANPPTAAAPLPEVTVAEVIRP